MRLNAAAIGTSGTILTVAEEDPDLAAKLREVGFAEGDEVEVVAFGPLGRAPICVRLNQTLIALRPQEAAAITLAPAPAPTPAAAP